MILIIALFVSLILTLVLTAFSCFKKRDSVNLTETTIQIYITTFLTLIVCSLAGIFMSYIYYYLWSNYNLLFKGHQLTWYMYLYFLSCLLMAYYPLLSFIVFSVRQKYQFDSLCAHTTLVKEEVYAKIADAVNRACREMNIRKAPQIKFSANPNIPPQIIPYGKNSTILLLPYDVMDMIKSVCLKFNSASLRDDLLEYVIRHELAHLYNQDIRIFSLFRWFDKSYVIYIYFAMASLLLYLIANNKIINGGNLHWPYVVFILISITSFYYVFSKIIERKRENYADSRAFLNSSYELKHDIIHLPTNSGTLSRSPFEALITEYESRHIKLRLEEMQIGSSRFVLAVKNFFTSFFLMPLKNLLEHISHLIYPYISTHERINKMKQETELVSISLLPQKDFIIWGGCIFGLAITYMSFFLGLSLPSELSIDVNDMLFPLAGFIFFMAAFFTVATWTNLQPSGYNNIKPFNFIKSMLIFIPSTLFVVSLSLIYFIILNNVVVINIMHPLKALLLYLIRGAFGFVCCYAFCVYSLGVSYKLKNEINSTSLRISGIAILSFLANAALLVKVFLSFSLDELVVTLVLYITVFLPFFNMGLSKFVIDMHKRVVYVNLLSFGFSADELEDGSVLWLYCYFCIAFPEYFYVLNFTSHGN